ncbi:MAG: hypothetical protein L0229_12795 [Blastocatellia bacterium]|nr:hypothetical protein [Blastocatellia bacterium]
MAAIKFDFTLIVCPIVNTVTIAGEQHRGEIDYYEAPYKEELIPISHSTGSPFDISIQFGERSEAGNVVLYKGFKSDDKHLKVRVNYDLLTLYADHVRFNKKTRQLEAEGNVVFEDGNQRVHAKRAVITFKVDGPTIKLT